MKTPIPVLVLFGPTASGKTGILFELFNLLNAHETSLQKAMQAEIISADSMQVYKGMDIGTAKPSAEERARLPHHLIDICDPSQQFNAGDFVRLADTACMQITQRGKLPVVSGGTGFYLKNFILGLSEAPPSNLEIRGQLQKELNVKGSKLLMDELTACDPVSAQRIHINDEYRLLRALEVYRSSGMPLSSYENSSTETRGNFSFITIGLSRPRAELYRRINLRCEEMFRLGLHEEVQALFKAGYTPEDPGLRAIGYREFFIEPYVSKETYEDNAPRWDISKDLRGVQALIAQNSRRYAKRQITFFAGIPDVKWIEIDGSEKIIAQRIREILNKEQFF